MGVEGKKSRAGGESRRHTYIFDTETGNAEKKAAEASERDSGNVGANTSENYKDRGGNIGRGISEKSSELNEDDKNIFEKNDPKYEKGVSTEEIKKGIDKEILFGGRASDRNEKEERSVGQAPGRDKAGRSEDHASGRGKKERSASHAADRGREKIPENTYSRKRSDGDDAADKETADKETIRINTAAVKIPSLKSVFRYGIMFVFISVIIIAAVIGWKDIVSGIGHFFSVLAPFFGAFILAFLLSPVVWRLYSFFQKFVFRHKKKKLCKFLSVFIVYMAVIAFIVAIFTLFIPQTASGVSKITHKIPNMYDRLMDLLESGIKIPGMKTTTLKSALKEAYPRLIKAGTGIADSAVPLAYKFSKLIVSFVINIVLAVIISIYIILDRDVFAYHGKRLLYSVISEKRGDSLIGVLKKCGAIFSSYLTGAAIDSVLVGILCMLFMAIFRIPFVVLVGVIVALTNMIPYFGPYIGAIPSFLIILCDDPKKAFIFLVIILCIQQFDGMFMNPRIVGQTTGLNPFWVIFAITVGGDYFGVIGLFLGVPVTAVLAYLIDLFIKSRIGGKHIKALDNVPESLRKKEDSTAYFGTKSRGRWIKYKNESPEKRPKFRKIKE